MEMSNNKNIMIIGCGDSGSLKATIIALEGIHNKPVLFHTIPPSIDKEALHEVVLQYQAQDMEVVLVSDGLDNLNIPMPEPSMPELLKNIIRDSQRRLEFIDLPIIEEKSTVNPYTRHNHIKRDTHKYSKKVNFKHRRR